MMAHLLLKVKNTVMEFYSTQIQDENIGYDLYFEKDFEIPSQSKQILTFGIQCEVKDEHQQNVAYFLVPRFSISKTNLLMVNSIGVIDASYRGEIMAVVYNYGPTSHWVKRGERLFQLIPINHGMPFTSVQWVETLSSTQRGTGGFGSTGK